MAETRSTRATTTSTLDAAARPLGGAPAGGAARARPARRDGRTTCDWWTCDGAMHRAERPARCCGDYSAISARRHRGRRLPRQQPGAAPARTWTATASAASVIYGPSLFGLPIADPGAEGGVPARVQRLGGRVQRARPRRGSACCRCCRRTRRRRRWRSSSASPRSAIAAPSSARSSSAVSDPAWERLWDGGRGDAPADQLPHRPRHVAGAASRTGSWELAAFSAVGADAARRAAGHDDLLRRARAPSRACGSCSPSRGIGWLPYFVAPHGPAGREARRQGAGLPAQGEAERDLPPPGLRHVRGGAARPAAHPAARPGQLHVGVGLPASRQHLPALARGDRATRSPASTPTFVRRRRSTRRDRNCKRARTGSP